MSTFVGLRDAAKVVGISTRHFHRIAEEEGLKIMMIGHSGFVVAADLKAMVERRGAGRRKSGPAAGAKYKARARAATSVRHK